MNASRAYCPIPSPRHIPPTSTRDASSGRDLTVPGSAVVLDRGVAQHPPLSSDGPTRTWEERFWSYVEKSNGCWTWRSTISERGYGRFSRDRHDYRAHRVAYELVVGPIPEGLQIDHLCRNRACVNPAHLEPVTCRENLRRGNGAPALNARKTHCKHGHEFTPENTYQNHGGRGCLTCKRAQYAKDRAKTKASTDGYYADSSVRFLESEKARLTDKLFARGWIAS